MAVVTIQLGLLLSVQLIGNLAFYLTEERILFVDVIVPVSIVDFIRVHLMRNPGMPELQIGPALNVIKA